MRNKKWKRKRACLSKVKYRTLMEAETFLAKIRDQGDGVSLEPYKCRFCAGFHLGHRNAEGVEEDRLHRLAMHNGVFRRASEAGVPLEIRRGDDAEERKRHLAMRPEYKLLRRAAREYDDDDFTGG